MSMRFYKQYLNIFKKSCGSKPNKIGTTLGFLNDSRVIGRIIKSCQNHPSVSNIEKKKKKKKIGLDLNILISNK